MKKRFSKKKKTFHLFIRRQFLQYMKKCMVMHQGYMP